MPSQRLLSLDIFRGMTIALMILVNNPGSWSHLYPPLAHAEWHGCTPTDWVFPFFLFIVGVAIPLALGRRKAQGVSDGALLQKIGSRTLIIFGLGLFLSAFPKFGLEDSTLPISQVHYVLLGITVVAVFLRAAWRKKENKQVLRKYLGWLAIAGVIGLFGVGLLTDTYDFSRLRVPGVLQRIALVYGICSLLYLKMPSSQQLILGVGILLGYFALLFAVPVPGVGAPNLEPTTNITAWLDYQLLGDHLWRQTKVYDPEGLLSTLPAIVTGIIGMQVGEWLGTAKGNFEKVSGLMVWGTILLGLALVWNPIFPINKQLWTSSYVLYTGGIAMLILGCIYWIVDIKEQKRWAFPFVVFGMNALFVFVLSGVLGKLLYYIQWPIEGDNYMVLKTWLFQQGFEPFFTPLNASLAFALVNVLFYFGVAWVLYKNKIFIKV